jgi:hypothetical protein
MIGDHRARDSAHFTQEMFVETMQAYIRTFSIVKVVAANYYFFLIANTLCAWF